MTRKRYLSWDFSSTFSYMRLNTHTAMICVLLHLHSALSLLVEQISICILFREFYIKNMFLMFCLRGRLCSAWPFILALLICLPTLSYHAEQLNRKVNALIITFLFILLRDSWSGGSLQAFSIMIKHFKEQLVYVKSSIWH